MLASCFFCATICLEHYQNWFRAGARIRLPYVLLPFTSALFPCLHGTLSQFVRHSLSSTA